MKKAIMYGGGNIGRGFIGQIFSESGYEVVFVDINSEVVSRLNSDKAYPVRIVSSEGHKEIVVKNVSAVDGNDLKAVAAEISIADIMATAVGVNILSKIIPNIARGIKARWEKGNMNPLNIIICENMLDANHYMKALFEKEFIGVEKELFYSTIGLVEASIGRMVPVMTQKMMEGNILRVWVEEYCELPVDKDAIKGTIPSVSSMVPFSPFEYYIRRKLFIHNLGHAVTAYIGSLRGWEYIWEAINDNHILQICEKAMRESGLALSKEYGITWVEIEKHIKDLLGRFGNKQLGDTIVRVGKDPVRKLSPDDRLIGAAQLCLKNGIEPLNICKGIAAAMYFNNEKDESALKIQSMIEDGGPELVMRNICGLSEKSPLWEMVLEQYSILKK